MNVRMRRQHGLLYPLLVIAAISIVAFSAWSVASLLGLFPTVQSGLERPAVAVAARTG